MEAYFLDVGQGTSNVVLHGNKSAIVIDCGTPGDRITLKFLKRLNIESISRLIVSHSHDDHSGGALDVLGEYKSRIDQICIVQDDAFLKSKFWKRLVSLIRDGVVLPSQIVRLEVTDAPVILWADAKKNAKLLTFSPSTAGNLIAQATKKPNQTSAVLVLERGKCRIVFASDSEIGQWQEIHKNAGKTIDCDVLAVPHHAGKSHQTAAELQWLFTTAVRAKTAVVSVGTTNKYKHPRKDVVTQLRSIGAAVLCTQISAKCSHDLEILRPGVLSPALFGRSSASKEVTASGNSRNVACAGTVLARISDNAVDIDRVAEHQIAVDKLHAASHGCPLCRP